MGFTPSPCIPNTPLHDYFFRGNRLRNPNLPVLSTHALETYKHMAGGRYGQTWTRTSMSTNDWNNLPPKPSIVAANLLRDFEDLQFFQERCQDYWIVVAVLGLEEVCIWECKDGVPQATHVLHAA